MKCFSVLGIWFKSFNSKMWIRFVMYKNCTLDFKWYFVHLEKNKCCHFFCHFLWSTTFALKFSLVALITNNYFDFLITVHKYFILQIYLWNTVKKFTGNLMFLCIFQLCKTQYLLSGLTYILSLCLYRV